MHNNTVYLLSLTGDSLMTALVHVILIWCQVDCIYDATKASEESGGDLRVKFLFDYMRGSRGKRNTRTMLLPLLKDFEQRVSVALYHTPDLRGIIKRVLPERYNETFGVAHMKIYLFDDTIIMSGYAVNYWNFITNAHKHGACLGPMSIFSVAAKRQMGLGSIFGPRLVMRGG